MMDKINLQRPALNFNRADMTAQRRQINAKTRRNFRTVPPLAKQYNRLPYLLRRQCRGAFGVFHFFRFCIHAVIINPFLHFAS